MFIDNCQTNNTFQEFKGTNLNANMHHWLSKHVIPCKSAPSSVITLEMNYRQRVLTNSQPMRGQGEEEDRATTTIQAVYLLKRL